VIPRSVTLKNNAHILIVDDEPNNVRLIEVMLAREGYHLETATSGEAALAAIVLRPPDLVLLDVMMAGKDGYQVATSIKTNPLTRNTLVIVVTALDDRESRLRGLEAGAEDFITKPVDRAELLVRVRNLLRLKAYGDYYDRYSQTLEEEVGLRTADLAENARLFRATLDGAPVGIAEQGLDGTWRQVNSRMWELLGHPGELEDEAAVKALPRSEPVAGEMEAYAAMAAGLLERYVIDEKPFRRLDGSTVWARVHLAVHRDVRKQAQHFILALEDITERRRLEAAMRQAAKMDAVGRLAAGVAHDFNNLLTVILGFAEIVTEDMPTDGRHREEMQEIIGAAQRAANLTQQLLAFSRQQVLQTAPLDVNRMVTGISRMVGRLIGENIEVRLVLSSDLRAALADCGQMEQVLMNLLVNARDAMPDGGQVTIETSMVELDDTAFGETHVSRGSYVMFAVTDTGTGMDADTQKRLFEPFFTTKEPGQGTGLGLSTTYGIVKQSNGYIWVYSEPGRGSTFKVYLPSAEVAAPSEEIASVAVDPGESPSGTILLVEDAGRVRKLTKRILDRAGYHVLEAVDGDDAERVLADHGASVDLMLTDVIMPGCGGPELYSRLEQRQPGLRVLYMSGYTPDSVARKAGLDRGLPYVQKPFTSATLMKQVRAALSSPG
jgi:PAS domain S-box-containing protein